MSTVEYSEEELATWVAEVEAENAAGVRAYREKQAREAAGDPPEEVPATAEDLLRALEDGGRAVITVRAKESGKHVTIRLTAKRRDPSGGYVSRATIKGRVGIREADMIFIDDEGEDFMNAGVGSFNPRTGEYRRYPGADPARAWAGEKSLFWCLGNFPLEKQAEVLIATQCCYCSRRLTDPESIERGIGPECFSRHTKSRAAARGESG